MMDADQAVTNDPLQQAEDNCTQLAMMLKEVDDAIVWLHNRSQGAQSNEKLHHTLKVALVRTSSKREELIKLLEQAADMHRLSEAATSDG